MQLEKNFLNYKIFRFLFSFAILVSFSIFAGTAGIESSTQIVAAIILFIYTTVSFLSIFIQKITIVDTILDVTFISAFIYTDFQKLKYFSILYLFPLFFSGYSFKSNRAYIVMMIALLEYAILFFLYQEEKQSGYLNLFLNTVAFFLITVAGVKLKQKIETQQRYIEKLEEEKREAEVYKKLYRISAELAHEIRNPLASIKAAAQLLSEGNIKPNLLKMIKDESERLNKLLSDFLLLSHPSKENEKVAVNVKEILTRIKEIYGNKKNIELNISGNPEIYINEKVFESAVSNVIKNATEWGRNKVRIKAFQFGNHVYIEVEDDGPGVDREIKDKIFEPFFTRNKNGTGLGLAIAKRVVIENGGDILVEKSPLGGAKFVLIFPVRRKNESIDS